MPADWLPADWPAPACIVAGTTLRDWGEQALPPGGEPCFLQQVHGHRVVPARRYREPPQADASVGDDDVTFCVIRTADCLPVLFCSEDGAVFAAAHAGWRGLAAGVLEETVATLNAAPARLLAWFGPAISQPAFEVGDEVRQAFVAGDAGAEACFEANERGRWQADLYALARRRLASVGVERTFGGEHCTFSDEGRFFSYRRDPDCGRLVSFIGRQDP